MRIEIHFDDRAGFTEALFGLLVLQHQPPRALEVVSRHVYLDLPGLTREALGPLTEAVRNLPGFVGLRQVSAMPRELRLRQLEAVIEAFPDPVLAINSQGLVVLSNQVAKASWGAWLAGLPVDEVLGRKGWDKADWQPRADGTAEFLGGSVDFAGATYLVERIPIRKQGAGAGVAGAVLVLRAPQRVEALRRSGVEASQEVGGAEAVTAPGDRIPASFAEAQKAFEAELLRRLFPHYPSSRKLAKRLKLSHTAVANKLRTHGIGRSD
ncbi:MAG: hypothetical protein QNJ30_01145 [Kiloniellales bacterium]|nr:hypothetical protein [Kiloniellales bacterium]